MQDLGQARRQWLDDGFVVVPALLSADELRPALAALPAAFPTADEFHDDVDPERNARFRSPFGGIDPFPMEQVELSLLAVHPKIYETAALLLGRDPIDVRCYHAEAWAKYTGATGYDQSLHRDYPNHTTLVPTNDVRFAQLECFLYLNDVPDDLGATRVVSNRWTNELPAVPHWIDPQTRPDIYAHEVSAAGPAGSVLFYETRTFHRGVALTAPRGARYTIHVNLRSAEAEWAQRTSWVAAVDTPAWGEFVRRATWQQLALFGFPPPGHPFWTAETLAGMAARYPGLDVGAWS